MPQLFNFAPQPMKSQIATEKAVKIEFTMHQHPPIDDDESTGTVYCPIWMGVYQQPHLVCADCDTEFEITSREIVEIR